MSEIKRKEITREALIDALIDLFNIREPIEAYRDWIEMSLEDLNLIYISETDKHNTEDYFYE